VGGRCPALRAPPASDANTRGAAEVTRREPGEGSAVACLAGAPRLHTRPGPRPGAGQAGEDRGVGRPQ
jgi:hypothetical protein